MKMRFAIVFAFLLLGCQQDISEEQQRHPEFTVRYLPVSGSNDWDSFEVVEITGHGHKCYILRTLSYGIKNTLWCEALP